MGLITKPTPGYSLVTYESEELTCIIKKFGGVDIAGAMKIKIFWAESIHDRSITIIIFLIKLCVYSPRLYKYRSVQLERGESRSPGIDADEDAQGGQQRSDDRVHTVRSHS